MGARGRYLLFGNGGLELGGMLSQPTEVSSAMWLHYIELVDLGTALARAKAAVARVLAGPMHVPSGAHVVQLADPQGAVLALHELPSPATS
jgi:uncharacterized protein